MGTLRSSIEEISSGALAARAAPIGDLHVMLRVIDLPNKPLFQWSGTMWVPVSGCVILGMSAVAVSCPVDATEDLLATINVPGGLLGPNGTIRTTLLATVTNSANNKTLRVRYGAGSGGLGGTTINSGVVTAVASIYRQFAVSNRGVANSQIGMQNGNVVDSFGSSTNAVTPAAIDSAALSSVVISGQKATAGETFTLESYLVEAFPG